MFVKSIADENIELFCIARFRKSVGYGCELENRVNVNITGYGPEYKSFLQSQK